MNILSLFDGISVARYALDLANIKVNKYYCSEIDKPAISISKKNYPNNISLGSVTNLTKEMIKEPIDLLIGGSPCQDLSIAKKGRKGLDGDRSGLFWEYVRLKNELQPKWFILENVASMPQKDKNIISQAMGCQPVMFNASLVSAQCRKRLFWTNIPFELPDDRGIILKDILQPDSDIDERMVNKNKKAYTLTASYKNVSATENQIKNSVEKKQRTMVIETKKLGWVGDKDHQANRFYDDNGKIPALASVCNSMVKVGHVSNSNSQGNRVYSDEGKSCTLSANGGGGGAKTGLYKVETNIRKLTPIECERLQSLPDNYTEGVAITNRYKCLGNAFNADVIAHILMHI